MSTQIAEFIFKNLCTRKTWDPGDFTNEIYHDFFLNIFTGV